MNSHGLTVPDNFYDLPVARESSWGACVGCGNPYAKHEYVVHYQGRTYLLCPSPEAFTSIRDALEEWSYVEQDPADAADDAAAARADEEYSRRKNGD